MASDDDPALELAEQILKKHDLDVALAVVGPWRHRLNPGVTQRLRSLYPDDWAVVADLDEFQEYPDDLASVVEYCEERGYDAVTGEFLDRIGPDGAMPPITDGESLWDTFPLGGDVTKGLLADPGISPFYSGKVVAAKGTTLISWGHHYVARGNPCPHSEISVPVHHFKWDAGVLSRLRARYELYTGIGEPYGWESKTFERQIVERGFIDVSDRRLKIRHVGNPYGAENRLLGLAAANST
jgi:hypothetical protein